MDEQKEFRNPKSRIHRRALEVLHEAQSRQLPSAIIIGAQKAGTTSLNRYLGSHPDIGVAVTKEVNFFSFSFRRGTDWYRAHFPAVGESIAAVETSPSYHFDPRVPERVHQLLPEAKLIVLLRNPIDRAYSHHQMNIKKAREPLSFEDAIAAEPDRLRAVGDGTDDGWRARSFVAYLHRGLYAEQLERWLARFPREQLLVLKSEDFFRQPREVYDRTIAFLGLRPSPLSSYEAYNPGAYDAMHPETRARLHAYFAPHNQRLAELLGEDFGWNAAP